jgi:hypothetical protein
MPYIITTPAPHNQARSCEYKNGGPRGSTDAFLKGSTHFLKDRHIFAFRSSEEPFEKPNAIGLTFSTRGTKT